MSNDPKNPYRATNRPVNVSRPSGSGDGDATGGLIPYKNPKALIAYYLGIGSLLIFPLGFVSIVLGFMGLADRKRNPVIKGSGARLDWNCTGRTFTALWPGPDDHDNWRNNVQRLIANPGELKFRLAYVA